MSAPATLPELEAPRLPAGARVHRYRIIEEIGSGGMARVYSAEDEELGRTVALKLIRRVASDGRASRGHAMRLLREAQAMAQLSHPNIVPLYDVRIYGQQVIIAMEYERGGTLRQWQDEPDRPLRELVDAYVAAGRGLAAAHRAGLVHRDFKPDNVLVSEAGEFKVTDFGLARATGVSSADGTSSEGDLGDELVAQRLTVTGALLGTPFYMAPEQHGGGASDVDARADQFSFCVSLYEAVRGYRPYRGTSTRKLYQAKIAGPGELRLTGIPRWLADALRRGLAPDPADRFESMDALLERLVSRRRPTTPWLVGVAVVGVGALVVAEGVADEVPACPPGDEQVASVWGPARQQQVRDALLASDVAYAGDTWRRVDDEVGRYVRDWSEAYEQACAAEPSEAVRARRACLGRRIVELDAIVLQLRQADRKALARAGPGMSRLPPVDDCSDADASQEGLVGSSVQRQSIARVQAALAQARAHEMTARFTRGLELADEALLEARLAHQPELVARALEQRGVLLQEQGRFEDARDAYAEAALLAEERDLPELAARNARRAMYVLADRLSRYEEADRWHGHAHAQLHRLEGADHERAELLFAQAVRAGRERDYDPAHAGIEDALQLAGSLEQTEDLRARLLRLRGALRMEQGGMAEGRVDLEQALKINEELYGQGHPRTAEVMMILAGALATFGDFTGASQQLDQALAILEPALGGDHPRVLEVHFNYGGILVASGQASTAREHLELAAEGFARIYGSGHAETARTRYVLGNALMQLGELDEAQAVLDQSIAAMQADPNTSPRSLGRALLSRGQVFQQRMQWDAAKKAFDEGREVLEAELGPDSPSVTDAMFVQGELAIQMGQWAYAVEVLEETLEKRGPMVSPIYLSLTEFELAKALWGDGQRERATELAQHAVARLRDIPSASRNAAHMDETLEAWSRGEPSPYGPQDPRRRKDL